MSEIVDFDVAIELGVVVAAGVGLLAVACARAGIGLATVVGKLGVRGAQGLGHGVAGSIEGMTEEMAQAIEQLQPAASASTFGEVPVDGIRSLATLRGATELVAKSLGGEMAENVQDAQGRQHEVLVGVRFAQAPTGIGVTVDESGGLNVVADVSVVPAELIDQFRARLETAYTEVGVTDAMRRLGYAQPAVVERAGDGTRVVLVGERA
jgi:hypothetical protein